jgi:hypothetical protein
MQGAGIGQDKHRAGLLLLKGCELQDGTACKTLGDFFATGVLEHKVLPQDMALAFKAFQLGCLTETRPNGEACSRAAQMLLTGEGCDQNQARPSLSQVVMSPLAGGAAVSGFYALHPCCKPSYNNEKHMLAGAGRRSALLASWVPAWGPR